MRSQRAVLKFAGHELRRAMMPLVGDDPFGEKFFEMYNEWIEAGSPYHGLRAPPSD